MSEPESSKSLTNYSSSFNSFVFDSVPSNSVCLDVGCSAGNLGAALIEKKACRMDGIESNPEASQLAKSRGYEEVQKINLDYELQALDRMVKKYDVIICADVLEHLISPENTLKSLQNLLKPNGRIIISLPNVAFLLNRLNLLLGRWDYTEYGILDRTHLKFYTIDSGRNMVASTGLKILKVQPYNQFGALRYIKPLDAWFPGLFAFQFMLIAGH